eukprot:GABV01006254.1.p2 GENE.GABV01006254.1~~GABV01006254.1.p2  ORF type:complete len:118 (+),score=30.28 GABV01006254.1:57-410(+)
MAWPGGLKEIWLDSAEEPTAIRLAKDAPGMLQRVIVHGIPDGYIEDDFESDDEKEPEIGLFGRPPGDVKHLCLPSVKEVLCLSRAENMLKDTGMLWWRLKFSLRIVRILKEFFDFAS